MDSIYNAWHTTITVEEATSKSYLAVAIPGNYGNEAAYAALKIGNDYVGAPDRAPSFESNHWEHVVKDVDGNYTYYFPFNEDWLNKEIDVYALG